MPTPHLDNLLQVVDEVRQSGLANEYAFACAVGSYADDPVSPTVSAVWYKDKLFSLSIAKAFADQANAGEESWGDIGMLVNAVIINAKVAWGQAFDTHKQEALEVLRANPAGGEAELRAKIAKLEQSDES